MEWLCRCGKTATTVEVLWVWRPGAAIGHRHGRYVSYRCRIGCETCVPNGMEKDCQYFQVKLTAIMKQRLVGQVLAQVLNAGPQGYLPRTDLQRALRYVNKAS